VDPVPTVVESMNGTPPDRLTRALILRSYEAFNARDLEEALGALHPDVDWPNAIEGGRLRGRDEVRRYWSRQFEAIEPRVEPEAVSVNDQGQVVVDVHQVVRTLDGAMVADERVRHVYTVRDGRIARMDILEASRSPGHHGGPAK
jgi:hypothetical protein